MHEGEWSTRLGLPGIPGSAEDVMVARDLILAEDTGGRYHVAHLSTARSLDLVRRRQARRACAVTCEVTPHHLLLTDEEVAKSGFSTAHQDEAAAALRARPRGAARRASPTARSTASPATTRRIIADEKDVEFDLAPFGILGLETTLCLCLDRLVQPGHPQPAAPGRAALHRSGARPGPPRRHAAAGQPGGRHRSSISTSEVTIRAAAFRSKSRNTPFDGWKLRGRPVATVVGGRKVEL